MYPIDEIKIITVHGELGDVVNYSPSPLLAMPIVTRANKATINANWNIPSNNVSI